jgi:hypothetical protein
MRFINFRIVTNGEKFRIEGSYYAILDHELKWITLANKYIGSDFGHVPVGEIEFDTKDAAIKYIKEEYGNNGYRNMLNTWSVC